MIYLNFNIRNPWANRFDNIISWSGSTPFKHKFWESEILKTSDIVGFSFHLTARQSHAGLFLSLALLGYEVYFQFYDCRHYDKDLGWM